MNDKLQRYLLNLEHSKGRSKAIWFREALGFTTQNSDDLARQMVFDASKAQPTMLTPYGQKYNQIVPLVGANGRQIDVLVSWIRNEDGVVRLTTAIPTKKSG